MELCAPHQGLIDIRTRVLMCDVQEEMAAHDRLKRPEEVYGDSFLKTVRQKHLLGKNQFATLTTHMAKARRLAREAST